MSTSSDVKLFKCLPIPPGDHNDLHEMQALRQVILHNIIIRGYNGALYYSDQVQPGTKQFSAFLTYCAQVNAFVRCHHSHEETIIFPFFESKLGKGSMSHNLAEHETFTEPLRSFEDLVASLQSGKTGFDAPTFRTAIYAFLPPMLDHLQHEIDTIRPEILRKSMTKEEIEKMEKDLLDDLLKTFSLVRDTPLLVVNGDVVHGAWFPPLPTPMMLLVKYVFWHLNSDTWAFGCCDKDRKVKPQFLPYEPELEPPKVS
ncbi:hypothetical protein FRB99_000158 [Tulasnella sp. 403]|nr:hypothetical protein FRB99_000158 [Tulasnella sp. 403]